MRRDVIGEMARKLKVVHVIGGGEYGGAEEHIVQLLSQFSAYGAEGKVVCFYDEGLAKALRERGIAVEVLAYPRFDARLLFALRALFRREQPDVIHTHGVKANFFGRIAARKLAGVPLVTTVHSVLRHDYPNRWAYRGAAWMERVTRRWNDHFIAVSHAIRDSLAAEGVPEQRISVVHHGIEYDAYADAAPLARAELAPGLPDDALVIGAVTRLVQIKAIDDVVRAMRLIVEKEPRAHLVICGTGPEQAALKRLAADSGVDAHVHFIGFRRDIPRCLHSFDCFVSASRSEGLGLNVLEAMAAGTPVVATPVGGIADFLRDGVNGVAVPPDAAERLAAAVLDTLADRERATGLAYAAQAMVRERFSLAAMAEATLAVYNKVQEGHHE